MIIDSLVKLGLTPAEAEVFSVLLDKGPSFVAPIVQETKKHRQIVYNALEGLLKKNLVTVSQRNRKQYYAIGDPKRLLIETKQKASLAEEVTKTIEGKLIAEKEQVETFVGADSYERGLADFRLHAEEVQEYIVIGGESEDWYEYTKPFFKNHVSDLRRLRRQGIDIFILFFESERISAEKYMAQYIGDPYLLKVSPQTPKLPHTAWLAGDHVYILTPASEPIVVHIKSKVLAEEYRKYFSSVWKTAIPLTKET